MTDPADRESVRAFIAEYLPSIDHLDALLLLARDETRAWTLQDATAELQCPPAGCEGALADLVRSGLVELRSNEYRYAPATDARRAAVVHLQNMNREHPVTLIREIYRQTPSAQSFADAFRIRRPEDDANG